jgi:uncharacterized protein
MEKLHPGAKWSFRIRFYVIMIFIAFFLSIFSLGGLVILFSESSSLLAIIGFSILGYIIFILVVGEIYANLAYKNWKYELTEDGLKKERGIIFKKYSTIPYTRVQNVDIYRGILARMLGFSTVMIHTAGYSGVPNAEGHLPAIETHKAEQIREFIMAKITKRS